MPNTYTELRRTVVGTATSSVTLDLTGISGYTDLELVIWAQSVSGIQNINMQFNSDTASNYSRTLLYGNGTSALSTRSTSATSINTGFMTTTGSLNTIKLFNYANTTTSKTILARGGDPADSVSASVGLWRAVSNAAITAINITATGNFAVGSTFSLYGIANADQGAAKATGGIITEDSQYWYHTFGASGTFTPKQSLSCDVLSVAGGGGGAGARISVHYAGGGGAGGVLGFASQSLTAMGYTVTVGGGGTAGTGGAVPTNGGQGNSSQFGALTASVGGGFGATAANNGGAGGSGGGGGSAGVTTSGGAATSGQGFAGGGSTTNYWSGGGGGAGAVGANGTSTTGSGYGGAGTNTVTNWGSLSNTVTATGIGVNGYIAGGGQGTATAVFVSAAGGGGVAGADSGGSGGTPATAGTANTGSGGGAGSPNGTQNGASGGSGIVIVRYAK